MKRNLGLALIATFVIALTFLLLPTSMAKRGKGESGKASGKNATSRTAKTTPTAANLFLPPQTPSGPISVQATQFAESIPLRDMESVSKPGLTEQQLEDREVGKKNRDPIRRIDPAARPDRDGALQQDYPKNAPNAPQVLPTPSLVFDGNSSQDNLNLFGFRLSPPDTEGDVGPNHYVQVINLTIRIFDKTGAPLIPARKFSSVFTALGAPCGNQDGGDPIALYDPMADRWMLSQFCFPNGSSTPPYFEEIAISQTSDPTGAYYLYNFPVSAGNNEFPDYPHLGVWPDAYYMSTNQFLNGGAFDGGGAFAFDRQKMLVGDPTASFIYFNRNLATFPEGQAGMLPADMDGVSPPPLGTACPFAYFTATEFADPADGMRIFDFHADFGVPANSTFIERPESAAIPGGGIPVAAFNPLSPTGRDDVLQPAPASATTARLDAISDRLMHRLQYINFGTHESLVVTNTVNVGADQTLANYRAGIRYYQFRKALGLAPWAPFEQATFAPADTTHRWMGSAAMNAAGDLAVGFSASSGTVFPSIRFAARFAADPPGGLAQGEQEMFTGTGVQTDTGSRWGDYSALSLDPSDDCTFWHTNETYTAASQATSGVGWLTKIGKFNLGSACTPFPKGTIAGQVTNCTTGLPVAGAIVKTSDGFFTTTDAGGNYTLPPMTPTTYTVTASKAGFSTATANGVAVTNGNTTTQNFCISPINIIVKPAIPSDWSIVSAPSGVEPGRRITVALGVQNIGGPGACTTALMGTLQTGGGVTNITNAGPDTNPKNYGAICSGDPIVYRNYTFVIDPALVCGANIVATLNLQDGATPYGPLTYTIPTGVTSAPTTISYTGPPVAVPDNIPAGVNIPVVVSGLGAAIGDFNFRVDGSSCNAIIGSTTNGIDHTWIGDLLIKVTSPMGTTVSVFDRPGVPLVSTVGFNRNNICQMLLDDDGGFPSIETGANIEPVTGSFSPNNPMSAFDGQNPNGTWTINVSDNANIDTGSVRAFSLQISTFSCNAPSAAPATISGKITTPDGSPLAGVSMNLSGARSAKVITDTNGNYRFSNVDTDNFYTVTPALVNYHFGPESRSFSLLANMTDAVFTATRDPVISGNAIDTADYFVRQHYLDFLGREPDDAGLNFWSDQILSCGRDVACIERRTINVSAAYFLSIEFQETGGLVDGLYRASYDRAPLFNEFMPDTATVARDVVVGRAGWAQLLAANKQAFVDAWVQRPAFRAAYGDLPNDAYVDALIAHTGVSFSQSERDALVSGLSTGGSTRADVLRQIAENDRFVSAKRNATFVMMQYFGYLRRDPDESGYQFWLNKLNQFDGNFERAEMVKAFLVSGEYRGRFRL